MRSLKWVLPGMLALVLAAVPALAQKEIVVDSETARVYPVEDGRLVRSPFRSNNRSEFDWKDIGTFRISEKLPLRKSNLYNIDGDPIRPGDEGAHMRYWMRLGGTAQGFHLSPLFQSEGSPHQSHGCYRLSRKSATWLYDWAPLGTPVHVVKRLADSRYAGLQKPHGDAAVARAPRRPKASKAPAPRVAAKAVSRSGAGAMPRAAVVIRPLPPPTAHAAVTIKPAARPARTRVSITRVAARAG